MKTIKFAALFIFSILFAGNLFAQQEINVPLSDPGKAYKLDLHLVDGSIKVTGYEGKDIMVTVETDSSKSRKTEESGSGMRRINGGNAVDLTATENNNTVNISSGYARKAVTIVVKVPQTAGSEYKISTVNNGDITISNLSGTLEVGNVNGAITCTNIAGSVVANTVNGTVKVTFRLVDAKAAMAFSTLNGNVDITFPADLKANMKLKSDRGDVFTDFDMAIQKTQPKASVTNENSMHRITIEDWVYGTIGGGGSEVMMKNMQGNIYVRKAK